MDRADRASLGIETLKPGLPVGADLHLCDGDRQGPRNTKAQDASDKGQQHKSSGQMAQKAEHGHA